MVERVDGLALCGVRRHVGVTGYDLLCDNYPEAGLLEADGSVAGLTLVLGGENCQTLIGG